jgi:hypothetical protein
VIEGGSEGDRRGEVWEERVDLHTWLFLVLGREPAHPSGHVTEVYALLDLESGHLDWVSERQLDTPFKGWRRIA